MNTPVYSEEEISKILDEKAEDALGIYPAAHIKNGVTIPRSDYGNGWNAFCCGDNLDNPESEEWTKGVEACKKQLEANKKLFRDWYDELQFENKSVVIKLLEDETIWLSFNSKNESLLSVNCNDLFYWACGDAENITLEEIPSLIEEISKDDKWGYAKWCCKRRKLRPQLPIVRDMKKDMCWTDELEELDAPKDS